VARVSYWALQENDSAIACELLYLRDSGGVDEQFKGSRLAAPDCPAYFAALTSKRPVVADYALTYPAISGLAKTYLQPLGISSMLDAPVWVGGKVVKPAAVDVRGFTRRLVGEVLSATDRRCPIDLRVSEIAPEIQADERLLHHIFTNLLTNAVKYSDAGRAIRFEIGHDGAEIVCAIRDQGIGIAEADREWLFDPFHRGHNVADRPGTGLGLVIVKRCVDSQGGKVEIESQLGEGTCVTVRLPMFSPGPFSVGDAQPR
jgi:anti-sigma regulatory factor (Ser/Thr protein kinase)